MRQFGAYTLEALLSMPFPAFAALFELANRAQADFTIETVIAGIAALNRGSADDLYDRRDGISRPPVPPPRRLTAEEMAMARKLAGIYQEKRNQGNSVPISLEELRPDRPEPLTVLPGPGTVTGS